MIVSYRNQEDTEASQTAENLAIVKNLQWKKLMHIDQIYFI